MAWVIHCISQTNKERENRSYKKQEKRILFIAIITPLSEKRQCRCCFSKIGVVIAQCNKHIYNSGV